MRAPVFLTFVLAATAASLAAQPVVDRVANTASFMDNNLPNGGIAQGSMFAVIGSGLGPAALEQISEFPLPTEFGGTSVSVTVAGTQLDAYMVFTLDRQLAVILPAETPVGVGTLTVTYNGQTSAPAPIRVVAHSFGMFAINQGGSGPGIVATPAGAVNTLTFTAQPEEIWIIWGSGIGVAPGDEAAGPLPGDLTDLDLKVYVGGIEAAVTYRGRSGCCSGIDQIAFVVPSGVSGCYVPLLVVVEGVPSNSVTMSINDGGGACSDSNGLSSGNLTTLTSNGNLKVGSIALNRSAFGFPVPPPLPGLTLNTDTAKASFGDFSTGQLIGAQTIASLSTPGTCTVYQFSGVKPSQPEPIVPTGLDAGTIMIEGAAGTQEIALSGAGMYPSLRLGGGGAALPGIPSNASPDYLAPGDYQIQNGAGGAAVGAFTGMLTIPASPNWTNKDLSANLNRSSGYTVTWTDATGTVVVEGSSMLVSKNIGAGFRCETPAESGTFTIPAYVLAALPEPEIQEGLPTAYLGVGVKTNPVAVQATGLDRFEIYYKFMDTRTVTYE